MEEPAYRQHPMTYHQHDESSSATKKKTRFLWSKLLLGTALLSILIFVIIDSLTTQHIYHGFQDFLEWIERNLVAGFFAFMGVYFVATIAFCPGSALTFGGGFIFGKSLGLGEGVLLTTVAALDAAFEHNGFRIFLLMRLAPILPSYNIINYLGGVTSMKLSYYTFALLGILPGTMLYSYIGATAGSLTSAENTVSGPASTVFIILGVIFGLLSVAAISYYAKREFEKIVAAESEHQNNNIRTEGDEDFAHPIAEDDGSKVEIV